VKTAQVRFDLYSHLIWWTFTFPGDNRGRWSDPVPNDDREQVRLRELVFKGLERAGLIRPGWTIWKLELQERRSLARLAVGRRPVAHWHGFSDLGPSAKGLSDRELAAKAWHIVRHILRREGLQVEEHPDGERRCFEIETVTGRKARAIQRRYLTPYMAKPKFDRAFNGHRWYFGRSVPRDERARVRFADVETAVIARRILRRHTRAHGRAKYQAWEREHGAVYRSGRSGAKSPPSKTYWKSMRRGFTLNVFGGYRAWYAAVIGARRGIEPLPLNPRPFAHLAEIERRVARARWSSRLCRWIGRPPVDGPVQLELADGMRKWADECHDWSERTEGLVTFEPCAGLPAKSWVIYTPDDMAEPGEPDNLADLPREKQLEIVSARYAGIGPSP